jgi:hypothetical protein
MGAKYVFNPLTGNLDTTDVVAFNGEVNLGTAAAPSVFFTGDTNTGIYSPGADQVAISTNGTERVEFGTSEVVFNDGGANYDFRIEGDTEANLFFVDASTNRVGLWTSTPAAPLHLMAESSGDGALIQRWGYVQADINNYYLTLKTGVSSGVVKYNFSMRNNGTDYDDVLVLDRGNVGIGTTGPSEKLVVYSSGAATTVVASSDISTTALASRFSLGNSVGTARFTIGLKGGGGEEGYLGTEGNFSFYFQTNGTERARIDSDGRLLVGTASQSGGSLLQVNDDRIRIASSKTPASASDTGTAGEICWDSSYIYVCTATDTWKRAALSTW